MRWWNTIAAQFETQTGKPYSWKSCREKVKKEVELRRAEIIAANDSGKELPVDGDWRIFLDKWITITERYEAEKKAAVELATQQKADSDHVLSQRDNMRNRLGEKRSRERESENESEQYESNSESEKNESETTQRGRKRVKSASQDTSQTVRQSRKKKPRPGDDLERQILQQGSAMVEVYKELAISIKEGSGVGEKELETIREQQKKQSEELHAATAAIQATDSKVDRILSLIQDLRK